MNSQECKAIVFIVDWQIMWLFACLQLTVKLDAELVLQDVILLLIQLFAIKLLQLSLNAFPPIDWLLLSSNGWFAVISLSLFRFRLIFSFIDLTSSRVASIKYRRLFNSFWSILNLLRFFSTIGISVVKENVPKINKTKLNTEYYLLNLHDLFEGKTKKKLNVFEKDINCIFQILQVPFNAS